MPETLERNLQALERVDADLAGRLRETSARPGLTWTRSKENDAPSATVAVTDEGGGERRITLASRFRPLTEADRLVDAADLNANAAIVVLGFGVGHHVAALVERCRDKAVVIVYEPDESLLRAVLEHHDVSRWIAGQHLALFAGDVTTPAITRRLESTSGIISQGVQFITHPPTRQLHAEAIREFSEQFAGFVAYCRTNLTTTFVHATLTCRNLVRNLAHYAAGPTINPLCRAAAGYPAVLVSAGPSLARNLALLAEPGVRDRVVIIAAQTVLKPLLARGIRPHFVTALDYHEISRRFYEDLPPLDGVTLVVDPKVNEAVVDHFPGPLRMSASGFLNVLLGDTAPDTMGLPAGSNVAHLSFYLAQHLGCDPIILIGQDLGFSNGLYYCPGTAIHDVWAPELNPLNPVETMEWQRIARHKAHLKRTTDQAGRTMYSDEQMLTYQRQFERDFAAADQTILNATEGGAVIADAEATTLRDALANHAGRELPDLPAPAAGLDRERLREVAACVGRRVDEIRKLRHTSQQTLPILEKMLARQRDGRAMERLFRKLEHRRETAESLSEAHQVVNHLNQVGVFRRQRADRAIQVDGELDPYERQRRQLERDMDNLTWLIDACEQAHQLIEEGIEKLAAQTASAGDGAKKTATASV